MIRFVQILKLAMETHEEGETNKQTNKKKKQILIQQMND